MHSGGRKRSIFRFARQKTLPASYVTSAGKTQALPDSLGRPIPMAFSGNTLRNTTNDKKLPVYGRRQFNFSENIRGIHYGSDRTATLESRTVRKECPLRF